MISNNKNNKMQELPLIFFIFIITNLASQFFQTSTTYNNGRGWDGVSYYQIATQISNGTKPETDAPFVYRLGTPFLAALFFKKNLLVGFKTINIIGNFFSVILFTAWFRCFIEDWRIRTGLTILFMTHWLSPIRFIYFYPVYTDSWALTILLLGLLLIKKTQTHNNLPHILTLSIVSFVGVFFREIALIIPVAFLSTYNSAPHEADKHKPSIYLYSLPLLSGISGLFAVHMLAHQSNTYSFVATAINYAYSKPFLIYLQAYFTTYGLIIIIPLYFFRQQIKFLSQNNPLLVYLIGFMILAWVGGTDTERILFWAAPVIYLLIGNAIEKNATLLSSFFLVPLLITTQTLTQRLFWTIPDYPNDYPTPIPILTILSNKFQLLDLFSVNGNLRIQAIVLFEYIGLSILMVLLLRYYQGYDSSSTLLSTIEKQKLDDTRSK